MTHKVFDGYGTELSADNTQKLASTCRKLEVKIKAKLRRIKAGKVLFEKSLPYLPIHLQSEVKKWMTFGSDEDIENHKTK